MSTHTAALKALSTDTACTNKAIDALQRFSQSNARGTLSDLAAAYYFRAQTNDRASDLLTALDHADDALALEPQSPEALFNRALIEEALGLDANAIASWDAFRAVEKSTAWTQEATSHRNALAAKPNAGRQWALNRAQLPAAALAGDRKKVRALIVDFAAAAQRWMEEVVLPQGDLQTAAIVAEEWFQITKDPYLMDAVQAARNPGRAKDLKEGHDHFKTARTFDKNGKWEQAGTSYQSAADALTRGGSPLRLAAACGVANAATVARDPAGALEMLDRFEPEARRYPTVLARFHAARGNALHQANRGAEALDSYEAAIRIALSLRDSASLASFHSAKAESLLVLGSTESALRELLTAMRTAPQIVQPREMLRLLRNAGHIALKAGHPRPALRYHDTDVLYQRAQGDANELNLAVALQGRAEAEIGLRQFARAQTDLEEIKRLNAGVPSLEAAVARSLSARTSQVEGQLLLEQNPARAIAALTDSLKNAGDEQTLSYLANLHVLRAAAYRKTGHAKEAEDDDRNALALVQKEQTELLSRRERGQHEEIWGDYFQRFEETYHNLIRQLVETGRFDQAFDVAEGRRAVEPLDLILQLPFVPERFKNLLGDDLVAAREDLQAVLPDDTFLIEYLVLDDQTFAWVISRDRFELVPLAVTEQQIAGWADRLQTAAEERDVDVFRDQLLAPYTGLIARPLAAIARMPRGTEPLRRLVFIPDGPLHGISFSALRNPETQQPLIRDAIVSVAGSATLYAFSYLRDQDLAAKNAPLSVLLLGNPAASPGFRLDPLPGAEEEVKAIGALYGAEPLIGPEATPAALFARAASSTIIHIAAHAVPNAPNPTQSQILLAPGRDGYGWVRAFELTEKARLDATRLFVFSACTTAGGAPVGPEGLAPLVRPVIGAGAPAVVGTLWSVRDDLSQTLLVLFHNHYLSGRDVAAALRTAQLELLDTSDRRHQPELAWGAFQAIGYAASPYAPPPQTTRRNQP